ncbi:hypothetical protein [Streptomyces niveus]|uniref:hypothetical protein n=1 Tax=Streptomyces niveus TaxID=193462 RepID=UPI0036603A99
MPYSIVAAPETGRTSWTAVLDAVRMEPGADVAAVTTVQIRERAGMVPVTVCLATDMTAT